MPSGGGRLEPVAWRRDFADSQSFAYASYIYTYDKFGQLTSANYFNTQAYYTYDDVGNRTSETVNNYTRVFGYDNSNKRLTISSGGVLLNTLNYDANGNLTNISAGPGTLGLGLAPMGLDWNVRGELVKWTALSGTVATQDYGYDAWGERRARTNSPAGTPGGFMYVGANRGKDLTTGMDRYVQTEP